MFGQRHHFISYSTVDALDFAIKLHDQLEGGYPKFPAWLDKRDLKPGIDWDTQIHGGIRDCDSLLFVMTPDSVTDNSVCKLEWSTALKYKKSVVLLQLEKCDVPFRLQNRQYIDFSSGFDVGLAKLRHHLTWLASPEGELQQMKDQLVDAESDLRRATGHIETIRIEDTIAELKRSITQKEEIVRNSKKVEDRTQQSIERNSERESPPEKLLVSVPQLSTMETANTNFNKTVFISYRRTDIYTALAVYQNLTQNGYDCFLDYKSIDAGSFERIILNQIMARAHFTVILTPNALKRCSEPGDWLRREIEYAVENKRNIVPLMFENFQFSKVQKYLTGKLDMLPQYNALEIPSAYFEEAMTRLHTRFLNKPLDIILHPTPESEQHIIADTKARLDLEMVRQNKREQK